MGKRDTISRSDDLLKDEACVESMRDQPSSETKDAINEARSGKTASKVDMSNFDSFMKCVKKL